MRFLPMSEALQGYLMEHANPAVDPVADRLAATTRERFGDLAGMNVDADQGRFFEMLVRFGNVTTAVEVGTFTGMSALWIARGLAPGGTLHCFDITDAYLDTAREAWEAAGVADRIEVHIGPAAERLVELRAERHVDFAFIDADKGGYRTYLDLLLPRLSTGGLIAVDNVLWSGKVIDDSERDDNVVAVREFNDHVAARDDVEAVVLPIGDGVTLIRRR